MRRRFFDGLEITVLTDGVLLPENGNVEENLKTWNIFSDYVPNITTLKSSGTALRAWTKRRSRTRRTSEDHHRRFGKKDWGFGVCRRYGSGAGKTSPKCNYTE